jgi:hypothetical protein
MTCERYKTALLLAAAGNRELDDKLASHVKGCSTCRATLRSERELFSRIDSTLRTQVNDDPPPGFLAALRLTLSEGPMARSAADRAWQLAGAAFALIFFAIFYLLINTWQSSLNQDLQTSTIEALPNTQAIRSAPPHLENLRARSRDRFKRPKLHRHVPREPEVLVPPDERMAFDRYVACVARHDAVAQAVVTPATNSTVKQNTELPRVHPVDIADLQFDRGRPEWIRPVGTSE